MCKLQVKFQQKGGQMCQSGKTRRQRKISTRKNRVVGPRKCRITREWKAKGNEGRVSFVWLFLSQQAEHPPSHRKKKEILPATSCPNSFFNFLVLFFDFIERLSQFPLCNSVKKEFYFHFWLIYGFLVRSENFRRHDIVIGFGLVSVWRRLTLWRHHPG